MKSTTHLMTSTKRKEKNVSFLIMHSWMFDGEIWKEKEGKKMNADKMRWASAILFLLSTEFDADEMNFSPANKMTQIISANTWRNRNVEWKTDSSNAKMWKWRKHVMISLSLNRMSPSNALAFRLLCFIFSFFTEIYFILPPVNS